MIPDKESDIKPRFHRAKSHSQKHQDGEVREHDTDNSCLSLILFQCSNLASLSLFSHIFMILAYFLMLRENSRPS